MLSCINWGGYWGTLTSSWGVSDGVQISCDKAISNRVLSLNRQTLTFLPTPERVGTASRIVAISYKLLVTNGWCIDCVSNSTPGALFRYPFFLSVRNVKNVIPEVRSPKQISCHIDTSDRWYLGSVHLLPESGDGLKISGSTTIIEGIKHSEEAKLSHAKCFILHPILKM